MRAEVAIIGLFLLTSVAAEQPNWKELLDVTKLVPAPYGLIGDIIKQIIEQFEGNKTMSFEKIEIDGQNRFQEVNVKTYVEKIHSDLKEIGTQIDIKNLTIPIKSIQIEGLYFFKDLEFPGGLTIYGDGKFSIELEDLTTFLRMGAKYKSSSGIWSVLSVAADASLKNVAIDYENFMYGEPMGHFIIAMINQIIPVFVELLSGLVSDYEEDVRNIIAGILNKIME